jgi:phosphoribosyl-AMP cyclohydrolase
MNSFFGKLKFDANGLIPAVIQDYKTSEVLTLCYMTKEALEKTLEEKKIYVFRRSQGKLMMKGGTSGCIQPVRAFAIDCEGKSLLFRVAQKRAACHTGYFSCYFQTVDKNGDIKIKAKRVFDPAEVYHTSAAK